jgi:4-amino-4-deoxy-L-arabinose transferase-like glycosyltransferase
LLFVAVSAATRGFLLGVDILDVDEASHIVGSWAWLRGRHLYVGFVDNKPPLLYVYYALAQLLFGRGMFAVHLVTVLFTVPAIAMGVSSCFGHDRRGLTAGLVFLVASATYLAHDMHAANCELLLLLPATWAVAVLRDEDRAVAPGWLLLAGALVGLAALFKQQALAWLPALGFVVALAARRRRRSLLLTASTLFVGVALPLLATWAIFAVRGEGDALVYWTLTYNFSYAQQPMAAAEVGLRFAKYFLPFLAATIGLWVWLPAGWGGLSRHQRGLTGGTLVASVPIAFIGFRMYPHYFVPFYVPLALTTAPSLARLFARPWRLPAKAMLAYGAASWLAFSVANGVLYLSGHPFRWEEHQPIYRKVAERLRSDACFTGASLFSWGPGPMFLYPVGLPSGSRFPAPYPTISGYVPGNWAIRDGRTRALRIVSEAHWAELMADLAADRTTYFLDATRAFPNWKSFALAAAATRGRDAGCAKG